ncbi:MAG: hypothetical protein M3R24_01575 [Chloroflexota bacterium]|nr:hypothetical protein [Chloroflexota bacterium]
MAVPVLLAPEILVEIVLRLATLPLDPKVQHLPFQFSFLPRTFTVLLVDDWLFAERDINHQLLCNNVAHGGKSTTHDITLDQNGR